MKKFLLLIGVLAVITGCGWFNKEVVGSGTIVSANRPVENFSSIVFTGQGILTIHQSDSESLQIEADDNLLPLIKSEVSNGVLHIEEDSNSVTKRLKPSKPIKIFVTVKDINEIIQAGTGQITTDSKLKTNTLTVNTSGAGKVYLDIAVEKFIANISGSAEYILKGSSDEQKIDISGAGLYEAKDLKSKRSTVNISGYAKITLNAEETLDIAVSGNGSVFYSGTPKVTEKVQGTAKIEQIK